MFIKVCTSAARFAHVLKHISVVKQAAICDTPNRTRLNTKMCAAIACVPVLMPKPLNDEPKHPYGKPPPMMVHNLNQLGPRRHVHWDAMLIKGPLAEPKRAIVTLTPNTVSQPLLAPQVVDPCFGGPTAAMQVHRPIVSTLVSISMVGATQTCTNAGGRSVKRSCDRSCCKGTNKHFHATDGTTPKHIAGQH